MIQSYPFYFTDWRSSELVMDLNLEEKAVYRELLDHCWERGDLPTSKILLAKMAGCDQRTFDRCWKKVSKGFFQVGDRYRNAKVEEKRPAIVQAKNDRTSSAAKAAQARWNRIETDARRNAIADADASNGACATHSEPQCESDAILCGTPSPSPSPSPSPHTRGACAPDDTSDRLIAIRASWPRQEALHAGFALMEHAVAASTEPAKTLQDLELSAMYWQAYWQAGRGKPKGLRNWMRDGDWMSPPAGFQPSQPEDTSPRPEDIEALEKIKADMRVVLEDPQATEEDKAFARRILAGKG